MVADPVVEKTRGAVPGHGRSTPAVTMVTLMALPRPPRTIIANGNSQKHFSQ